MGQEDYGTIIAIGNILVSEEVVTEEFACDYEKCHGACCVVGDSGAPMTEEEAEAIERDYDKFSADMTSYGRQAAESSGFFELDRDGEIVTPTVKTPHKVPGLDFIKGALDGEIGTQGLGECAYIHFRYSDSSAEGEAQDEGLKAGARGEKGLKTEAQSGSLMAQCESRSEAQSVSRPDCLCAIEKCFLAGHCSFRKPISCSLYPIRVTRLGDGGLALNLHRWDICSDAYEKGRREHTPVYEFLRAPLISAFGPDFYSALTAAAQHLRK